jgi:hypothetical protein
MKQTEIQRTAPHYIAEDINLTIIAFIITIEDESTTFLRNVGKLLPDYTASYR